MMGTWAGGTASMLGGCPSGRAGRPARTSVPRIRDPACGTALADGIIDHRSAGQDWFGHERAASGCRCSSGRVAPLATPVAVTGALRLPGSREHAGGAARCIPVTGQKPHGEPDVRRKQRVGWTRNTHTELVEEI